MNAILTWLIKLIMTEAQAVRTLSFLDLEFTFDLFFLAFDRTPECIKSFVLIIYQI